jgi:polyferredoxin
MAKIGKPRGLIDYMALTDESLERAGNPPKSIWKHIFRLRTIIYTTLWSAVGIGLVAALFMRADIGLSVAPVRNPTFVTLSDGSIRNTYDVRLRNKHGDDRPFAISVVGEEPFEVQLEGLPDQTVIVPADSTKLQRVYVVAPRDSAAAASERTEFRLWVEDLTSQERAYNDSVFNGRAN